MSTPVSFEDQVNETAALLVKGDDGKLSLPEGKEASDEVLYAAKLEIRRRDTYSSFSRTQNENKALKAENEALSAQWEKDAIQNLSSERKEELDELKRTDPDKWRVELDNLTEAARQDFQERRTEVKQKARHESELEYRTRILENFIEENPTLNINDDFIENDVPPRLTKQLEKGEITFDEFLNSAAKFADKKKVVADTDTPADEPNLGDLGGSSTPSDEAIANQANDDYKNEVY